MDRNFLLKLIRQVSKTYTYGESLPLTINEETELITEIQTLQEKNHDTELIETVHDVVYRFFTGQSDD